MQRVGFVIPRRRLVLSRHTRAGQRRRVLILGPPCAVAGMRCRRAGLGPTSDLEDRAELWHCGDAHSHWSLQW